MLQKELLVMKFYKITLFCVLLSATAFAQPHPILDDFSGARDRNTIVLRWTITSGSTCDGIQIYRATDTTSFYQVGDIAGICGNSSAPVSYTFVDANPIPNQINYYRLSLGTQGFSDYIAVEFVLLGPDGYQVRPNPAADNAVIYFDNAAHLPHSLLLYDEKGILATQIENETGESFNVDLTNLNGGLYFFVILNEGKKRITGLMVIL